MSEPQFIANLPDAGLPVSGAIFNQDDLDFLEALPDAEEDASHLSAIELVEKIEAAESIVRDHADGTAGLRSLTQVLNERVRDNQRRLASLSTAITRARRLLPVDAEVPPVASRAA